MEIYAEFISALWKGTLHAAGIDFKKVSPLYFTDFKKVSPLSLTLG